MVIEKKVLLLGIYKKKDDESLQDVLISLEASKVFTLKQGKKYLKELKNENYIDGTSLSFSGVEEAKRIEQEFKV